MKPYKIRAIHQLRLADVITRGHTANGFWRKSNHGI